MSFFDLLTLITPLVSSTLLLTGLLLFGINYGGYMSTTVLIVDIYYEDSRYYYLDPSSLSIADKTAVTRYHHNGSLAYR